MSVAFADTSFYLALLDARDPLHDRSIAASRINRAILTTEFIILELGNACGRAEDHADYLAMVAGIRASQRTTVVPLDSRLLQRGLDLLASRADKNWSLTDCTSFVVMQDAGINDALTADRHFEQAGFKPLLA